jgi:hypothetical protein
MKLSPSVVLSLSKDRRPLDDHSLRQNLALEKLLLRRIRDEAAVVRDVSTRDIPSLPSCTWERFLCRRS